MEGFNVLCWVLVAFLLLPVVVGILVYLIIGCVELVDIIINKIKRK